MGYIYLRKNLTNGKCYVGQAKDIEIRNRQWKNLNFRYAGYVINNARKKYGTDGFSFEILKECPNEDMNYWETYYVKMYNSKKPYGYNSTDGGDSIYEMTDEVKKKIGAALRGRKRPAEAVAKSAAAHRGKKHSEETRKKMSAAQRGKSKPKVSAALRGRKRPDIAAALRGKKLSEETKVKIAAAFRGKPNPKVAAALRGRKRPDISAKLKGRKLSPEHVAKVSIALKGKPNPKLAAALSKAVQALDKITGEVVFTFPSAKEAGRQGFNSGCISDCCNGKRKSHGGYFWRYAEKK